MGASKQTTLSRSNTISYLAVHQPCGQPILNTLPENIQDSLPLRLVITIIIYNVNHKIDLFDKKCSLSKNQENTINLVYTLYHLKQKAVSPPNQQIKTICLIVYNMKFESPYSAYLRIDISNCEGGSHFEKHHQIFVAVRLKSNI